MKIKYEFVNGDISEVEVETSKEIERFYIQSIKEEKSNNWCNSRRDRHTSLYDFNYEDEKYFSAEYGLPEDIIGDLEVERLMSCLNDNQKFLVQKCVVEGRSYAELARLQNKNESTIRGSVKDALKKIKKIFF